MCDDHVILHFFGGRRYSGTRYGRKVEERKVKCESVMKGRNKMYVKGRGERDGMNQAAATRRVYQRRGRETFHETVEEGLWARERGRGTESTNAVRDYGKRATEE